MGLTAGALPCARAQAPGEPASSIEPVPRPGSSPAPPAHASPGVALTTRPGRLVRGALGELRVAPVRGGARVLAVRGAAAGEPLHFEKHADGSFRALAAAPVDGPDSLAVVLFTERAGAPAESIEVRLPLAEGRYRRERLRVPPQFAKPDSAAELRIASEIERAQGVGRQAHETAPLWRRPFTRPRPGRITSRFGTSREFNGEVQSRHMGTDFAGAVGAPVRAANAGVVALVADFYLAGTAVYLDHGGGLVTGYFHLSRALVAAGDTVRRGQIIGRVGRSGRVTGPHLHWIARYGAITVDPMSLPGLDQRGR
ncbi:MAG TPA: peptidoglycan DD-metalloendopeptidase family protein [Gemmatimonadales bacterium]|nr:peptidoglycan DD-metalloendopeptidase family protein [Gemmatimonadales bacterium]